MTTTEGRLTPEREAQIRRWYPHHYFILEIFNELDAVRRELKTWERECLRWRQKWQDEVGPIMRELDKARKDSARLDWLETEAGRIDPLVTLVVKVEHNRYVGDWGNVDRNVRQEIDTAMAKDGGA